MIDAKKLFAAAQAFWTEEWELAEWLLDIGFEWDDFWFDTYDESLELSGIPIGIELTDDQKTVLRNAGFNKVWLNYIDGNERLYLLQKGTEHYQKRCLPVPVRADKNQELWFRLNRILESVK